MNETKSGRLAALEGLPDETRDHALVDWRTVTTLLGMKDVEHARKTLIDAGLPLVHVSERRRLPRWGTLRRWIESREGARS